MKRTATISRIIPVAILLLTVVLSGPLSASAAQTSGPSEVYFPETGHHLGHGFLGFWRDNGALPVFGYPVSEEMRVDGVTIQYFERAVFEWHPEDTNGWNVQPRLLGSRAAGGRMSEPPFRTVGNGGGDQCTWYEATGHRICSGFRDYWENHGGLPTFGYPLSEEFSENGHTVQYFERAVFEWHPGDGGVLLRHLGSQAARRDGITPSPVPQESAVPVYSPDLWTSPEQTSAPNLTQLEADLRNLVSGWEGQNAVSVTDLQTGQTISINGDRRQLAACTNKIYIMVAIAQDIEAGLYTRSDVEHLVRPAMGPSLTPPAKELIRIAGGGSVGEGIHRVNRIIQELGGTGSIITHPPGYVGEEYGYAASHGIGSNYLTTDDLNRALGKIYRGEVLSPEMTEYVLWSMTIATPFLDGSMLGPLPPGTTVYHKIGVLYEPWNTWNDSGIVVFNRGGQRYAYALSYLSYDNPDTYKNGYWHGQTLSSIVWQAFQE